jgi:hypothetical protein
MIAKNSRKTKVKLTATISLEADNRLNQDAVETGNKSFLVDKIIKNYYGITQQPSQVELEDRKAS